MLISKEASELLNELLQEKRIIDSLIDSEFKNPKYDNTYVQKLFARANANDIQLSENFGIELYCLYDSTTGEPY